MARFSFVVLAAIVSLAVASPAAFEPRGTPVPFTTVPVKKTSSGKTKSVKALMARDLSRFNVAASAAVATTPATNEDDTYVTSVKVGTQTFSLIVDTGSSNTWVGAGTKYSPGSTATDTRDSFEVEYGVGSASGTEYTDNVEIGGLTISKQSIGDASRTSSFDGVDGIVGFGPVDLTEETVSGQNTVPTVMQNLLSQGLISTNVLGVYFAPESGSDVDDPNGELALGGVDSSKYTGTLTYVSVTKTSPYNEYWGITVSSTTYNGKSIGSSANAIVDTGTTFIYIPTATYNTFASDSGGQDRLGHRAAFVYTFPQAQYAVWGLPSGKYYSFITAGGTSAADVNFIIGQKFLENYRRKTDTLTSPALWTSTALGSMIHGSFATHAAAEQKRFGHLLSGPHGHRLVAPRRTYRVVMEQRRSIRRALVSPFQWHSISAGRALAFRANPTCTESECFLVAYDMHLRTKPRRPKIYVSPQVNVGASFPSTHFLPDC
ncbi:Aspartic protease [Mycena chlorophos]|uniref:Aspartic protease n=1 Tax=Mycena chlorophos TaxID=658473 RepID=A0A8H6TQC0_MYCCL|nr:Aspartic protease [Mycena chlorophos]